jgi:single-strand DNA-binding protein
MNAQASNVTNVAVVHGQLSGPPRRRELPSGSVLVELDVTSRGEHGSCSVPVAWFDPGAAADALDEGESVLVVGYVRRRFFRSGGATQSRTEVVAQRVVPVSKRAQVARVVAEVAASITAASADVQPVRSRPANESR